MLCTDIATVFESTSTTAVAKIEDIIYCLNSDVIKSKLVFRGMMIQIYVNVKIKLSIQVHGGIKIVRFWPLALSRGSTRFHN